MNTKGIKFLAVLAVLVMAFAAIAVIAPSEENDAAESAELTTLEGGEITGSTDYYAAPGTVTCTEATFAATSIYMDYGAKVTLNITTSASAELIIYALQSYDLDSKKATYEADENLTWTVAETTDDGTGITITRAADGGITVDETTITATPVKGEGLTLIGNKYYNTIDIPDLPSFDGVIIASSGATLVSGSMYYVSGGTSSEPITLTTDGAGNTYTLFVAKGSYVSVATPESTTAAVTIKVYAVKEWTAESGATTGTAKAQLDDYIQVVGEDAQDVAGSVVLNRASDGALKFTTTTLKTSATVTYGTGMAAVFTGTEGVANTIYYSGYDFGKTHTLAAANASVTMQNGFDMEGTAVIQALTAGTNALTLKNITVSGANVIVTLTSATSPGAMKIASSEAGAADKGINAGEVTVKGAITNDTNYVAVFGDATLNAVSGVAQPAAGAITDAATAGNFIYGKLSQAITITGTNTVTLTDATGNITVRDGTSTYAVTLTGFTGALQSNNASGVIAAAEGELYLKSGTASIGTEIGSDDTFATIRIAESATLKVTADIELTGEIDIFGVLTSDDVDAVRTITAPNEVGIIGLGPNGKAVQIDVSENMEIDSVVDSTTYTKLGKTITVNTPVEYAILIDDLTVPAGITLTVEKALGLNGYSLTIEGTLIIASGAVISGTSMFEETDWNTSSFEGANTIILGAKGTIDNSGSIGTTSPVYVTNVKIGEVASDDSQYAAQQGVTGVSYAVSGKNLVVSGNIDKMSSTTVTIDTYGLAVRNAKVGDLTIGTGVCFLPSGAVANAKANIVVNGMLGDGITAASDVSITLANGSQIKIAGAMHGTIKAQVKDGIPASEAQTFKDFDIYSLSSVYYDGMSASGFTLYVDRVTNVTEEALTYDQKLYIKGDVTNSPITSGQPSVGNELVAEAGTKVYVNESDNLNITAYGRLNTSAAGANLVVEGTVVSSQAISAALGGNNYTGTTYTLVDSTTLAETNYISEFNAALAIIGLTKNTTITVNGTTDVEFDDSVEIEKDQKILGNNAVLIIPEGVSVMVDDQGTISSALIKSIKGVLTVSKSGACTPAASAYDVMMTDADSNKIYSGIQTALDMAEAGSSITLSTAKTGDDALENLSIPAGVKLIAGADLSVTGTLAVATGAELKINDGYTLTVGTATENKGKMNINGTLDNSEGTLTVNGQNTATGKTVINVKGQIVTNADTVIVKDVTKYNGAIYTDSTKGTIATTVEAALTAQPSAVKIYGEIADTGSYELKKDAKLTIAAGAMVTLGTITIKDASVEVNGTLTATLVGVSGEDLDYTEVYVGQMTAGTISDKSTITAKGETLYTFTNTAMTAVSFEAGDGLFTVGATITGGTNAQFTVSEDAVLDLNGIASATSNFASAEIDGTITNSKTTGSTFAATAAEIAGTVIVPEDSTITLQKVDISGDVYVAGTLNIVGAMVLTGDIVVVDTEDLQGTLNLNAAVGYVLGESEMVGASGSITGSFTLGSSAYLLVFPGSTVDTSKLLYSTEIYINDELYGTAYASGAAVTLFGTGKAINSDITIPGYSTDGIQTPTNWIDENGKKLTGDVNIGAKAELFYTATILTVEITTSHVTGTSLYIDNVKVTGNSYELTVGEHKVTAVIDPGYKGTTYVQYDGATVTGTIIVEPLDDGAVLAVMGDIQIDPGDVPTPEPAKEQDNTITTVLLVVLVIIVAIMAVVTVMRMMRN